MNKLMERLNITKSDIVASAPLRSKGKETTDSDLVKLVRVSMNNTFTSQSEILNSATYFEPIYARDDSNKFLLDKKGDKTIQGYKTKNLMGNHILEDNGDGTHTATKFNVYKDVYLVDSSSINITKVTNGNGSK